MPDSSHVGRRYAAAGQVVDADRLRRFAAAIAGDDPVAADLGAVPPTFAAVYCLFPTLGSMFGDADLGIRLDGMVHAEQEFTWHAPVAPGDTLDSVATIAGVAEKRGRTFLTLHLETTRQETRETVLTGRTLLLLATEPAR
ncbi:MAG TPA: MaoC family dehydratase N-terminal domain-containing protein [Candidatus Dormibacteraeota bacterium]|nr:MaoC family dehydratase N-terminal domain-containing protein [Candidatus Dormibacteraeota bacterium]